MDSYPRAFTSPQRLLRPLNPQFVKLSDFFDIVLTQSGSVNDLAAIHPVIHYASPVSRVAQPENVTAFVDQDRDERSSRNSLVSVVGNDAVEAFIMRHDRVGDAIC